MEDTLSILQRVGALITGSHVVYTSGRHGSSYVNKDALYPHTAAISAACAVLAAHFRTSAVELVAGPTVGGVIMAQWTAHHLSALLGREVLAIYAEEATIDGAKGREFRRGYDALLVDRRVLIVEDILTTGGSARQVVEAVERQGGSVVGVAALCNRGAVTAATLGAPQLFALTSVPLESFAPEECPLCAAGVAVNTSVGKGAAFVAQQGAKK
ncbi:phosphoribosyltransferase [Candidatus Gracilibacteria bacterium]|nr:phosphoribosyltransferase [Candidatus Gracilibacteria bacterium]